MKSEEKQIDAIPDSEEIETQSINRKSKAYDNLKRKLNEKELLNIGSLNLMIDD